MPPPESGRGEKGTDGFETEQVGRSGVEAGKTSGAVQVGEFDLDTFGPRGLPYCSLPDTPGYVLSGEQLTMSKGYRRLVCQRNADSPALTQDIVQ